MGNESALSEVGFFGSISEFGDFEAPFRKRHSLNTVLSSMLSKRLLSKFCHDDMAVPVFTHSSTGDVLVSCLELSCECKLSDHARLALFSPTNARPNSRIVFNAVYKPQHHHHEQQQQPKGVREKKPIAKRRSKNGPSVDCYATPKIREKGSSTNVSAKSSNVSASFADNTANAESQALKLFADFFRRRRFELGYTQKDVAAALAEEYRDIEYTQPSIAKFEHLHFSPSRLNQMKMRLEKWLEEAELLHALKGEAGPKNGANGEDKNSTTSADDGVAAHFFNNGSPAQEC